MSTEYIICRKLYSDKNSINQYLINKYKNKLTDIINKDEFLKINFEQIKGLSDAYMCSDQRFIQFIRKNEPDNYKELKNYIFITIQDKFKKYIKFNVFSCYNLDELSTSIILMNNYVMDDYNDEDNSFDESIISVKIDINNYYKDLILNSDNIDDIKNNIILNINDIIRYDFN